MITWSVYDNNGLKSIQVFIVRQEQQTRPFGMVRLFSPIFEIRVPRKLAAWLLTHFKDRFGNS